MNKWSRMAATSAIALALAAPAYAQTTTPTPSATPPPSPSDSSSSSGSTMGGTTQGSTTETPSTPTASAGEVITEQQSGQTLSSDLICMKVVGANQESIGKVSELIIENDQVIGAVLDVGGFLGLGKTRVRLLPSQFTVTAENKVQLSLTADQVKSLPALEK